MAESAVAESIGDATFGAIRPWSRDNGIDSNEGRVRFAQYAILRGIALERKGVVFTFRPIGEEVWSYPAYRFETVIGLVVPDAV